MTVLISNICLLLLLFFDKQETRVLFSRRTGTTASSALIVGDVPVLDAAISSFRSFEKPTDRVLQYQVFSNKEFAANVLAGKGATDLEESAWHSRYLIALAKYPLGGMAEVLKVGSDIAARSVMSGQVSRRVIAGKDPYYCDGRNRDCEIVWISIGRIPPGEEADGHQPMIHLFVRTAQKISIAAAMAISNKLQVRFANEFISVAFRSSEWFVNDVEFPVIYPFASTNAPVDPKRIDVRDDAVCVSFNDKFSCQ